MEVCSKDGLRAYAGNMVNDPKMRIVHRRPAEIRALFAKGPFCHFFARSSHGVLEVRGAIIVGSDDDKRRGPVYGYWFVAVLWDADYVNDIGSLLVARAAMEPPSDNTHPWPDEARQRIMLFRKPLCGSNGAPACGETSSRSAG